MKVLRHVYIYFLTYFFVAGLAFFTISILTRSFTTYDYGVINLYSSFIIIIVPFISMGVAYPLSVEYYKKDSKEYAKFFSNSQAITLLSFVIITLLLILLQQPLSKFLRVSPIWIILLPITAWMTINFEFAQTLLRIKNRPVSFAALGVGKQLLETVLTIAMVVGIGWAWQGRLLSAAISIICAGLMAFYLFNRWNLITRMVDWKAMKRIAWISFPFIFERLSIFVFANSDRYFIDKYAIDGTNQVGLYSVGAQIAAIVYLVTGSLNSAYQPYIFQNLKDGMIIKARKSTGLYIGGSAVMVLGLMLATPILFQYFIGEQFRTARVFAYYLTGAYFMWAVYNALLPYLIYYGKSRLISYMSVTGVIISISLNFILVPIYGTYGAALSCIATYTSIMLLCGIFAWKYIYQEPLAVKQF